MPFRPHREADARLAGWRAFAKRLELEDATDQAERVRRWLALGAEPIEPLYSLRRIGQPSLYLFDQRGARSGPTGSVPHWLCGVLLRAPAEFTATSLRATPRRNKVMESLEASRTGSRRLVFEPEQDGDDAISVYARDGDAAGRLLQPAARRVLCRALTSRGAEPVVVVGSQHMIATAEGREPTAFDVLEALASDLLSLFAMLSPRSPNPGDTDGPP